MNPLNPKKLLLSKWTAVTPVAKQRHFLVSKVIQPALPDEPIEQVEIEAKYRGYIVRQQDEVARNEELESLTLPKEVDYRDVRGLSNEVQQKLNQYKPGTVGQAARISGVTPAAISLLLVHLKKRRFRAPNLPHQDAA